MDGGVVDEAVVEVGAKIDAVVVDEETTVDAVVEAEARRDAVGAVEETVVKVVVNGGSG